jgi:hypothetical protein
VTDFKEGIGTIEDGTFGFAQPESVDRRLTANHANTKSRSEKEGRRFNRVDRKLIDSLIPKFKIL